MRTTQKKRFGLRVLCILLAVALFLPLTVAHGVGITPEQLNEMAIDPQSWRFPHDTRHTPIPSLGVTTDTRRTDLGPNGDIADTRYSFVPNPVVNWQSIRAIHDDPNNPYTYDDLLEFPGELERRTIRGAVLLVEFPDMPMFSSLPQGAEIMGNPQVDTGVYGLEGEARAEALRIFWRNFLNEHNPEMNRGHNINNAWLEYSHGLWDLELEVYGPIMMPNFRFMYAPNGTFWSGTTTQAMRNIWGNFNFHGQFPQVSASNTLAPDAANIAVQQGVPILDEQGAPRYDVVFFTFAGYCQSPTWQEFGSMMFEGPRQVRDTQEVRHPVTREVLPDVTGHDFTGYAHMERLRARVAAPDFDLDEEFGESFFMTNLEAGWRTHVTPTAAANANTVPFTTTRDNHEGLWNTDTNAAIPGVVVPTTLTVDIDGMPTTVPVLGNATQRTVGYRVAAAYTEFRTQFPASNRRPDQFRDDMLRPAFATEFALQNRYEGPSMDHIRPLLDAIEALGPLTVEVAGETGQNTAAQNTARTAAIAALLRALPEANAAGVGTRFDLFGATGNNWTTGSFRAHISHGFEVVSVDLNVAGFVAPAPPAPPADDAEVPESDDSYIREDEAETDTPAVTCEFTFEFEEESESRYAFEQDGVWYLDGEEIGTTFEDIDEAFIQHALHPSVLEIGASFLDTPEGRAIAFAAQARPMWTAFSAERSPDVVVPRLLTLMDQALDEARNDTRNPFFQAAPTRYVPWTSWYGVFGVWSHASSMNVFHPNVGTVNLPTAVQGEGAAMAVYSHELGHVVRLPDNDNMVYFLSGGQPLPTRSQLGPWNIMARGAHVGYYGGHTRWNIPGLRAGSAGTGLMSRMRIGAGFTDVTNMQGQAPGTSPTSSDGRNMRNWIRPDHQNSVDIKYIDYADFRTGAPVVAEVFGRNIPTNRGFEDYYGNPITGYTGFVIQGTSFVDRTPTIALTGNQLLGTGTQQRFASNLLGVQLGVPFTANNPLSSLPRSPVHASGDPVNHRAAIIDPERWNWSIGGPPTMQTSTNTTLFTGLSPTPSRRTLGFAIDVINRVGYDSFSPDHGVLISRIGHTNLIGQGNMDGAGIFVIDAHPGNNNMIQFREADGTPYFFGCEHHVQIANATFRAGLHNNPDFYRDLFPERFLPIEPCGDCVPYCRNLPALMTTGIAPPGGMGADPKPCYDPRPGFAGHTVNEWVDEFNEFHFYILGRNNYRGQYGDFHSYDVAVRNTAPNAYRVGGELELAAVGRPSAAAAGNFAAQRFELTASSDATATDIVRINLEGGAAERVMATTEGGYTHEAHTMDQNVVLLNNLYAIEPGETIAFYVYVRAGLALAEDFRVSVVSETNSDKYANADVSFAPSAAPVTVRRNQQTDLSLVLVPPFSGLQDVTWTSSNPTLATVDANGVVTARATSGTVVITARSGGQVLGTVALRLSA